MSETPGLHKPWFLFFHSWYTFTHVREEVESGTNINSRVIVLRFLLPTTYSLQPNP